MGSRGRTLDLTRKIPSTLFNYVHPWLRARVRWHHRFRKEDFRTLDKRNQENAKFFCRLIECDRMESTAYGAKWATIIGSRVLDLAFLGPEVQDAREEIEDIFFLRYYKNRQYHIDKLYKELVPQLEFVDGELIRTHFLGYNRKMKINCVIEFANNGLPALPIPEECYQIRRPLTYPEIVENRSSLLSEKLKSEGLVSERLTTDDVSETAQEMLQLLPEAKRIQKQRTFNTQLDLEGDTLSWQATKMQDEVDRYLARYTAQEHRNAQVKPGEVVRQYHKPQLFGYRVKLPALARTDGLAPTDFNNGYDQLYKQVLEETGK